MVNMTVYSEVKRLYSSLQEMVGLRRRKRQLQIVLRTFDFKREATIIPGLTEDEISVLREKAAASRLGIAHADAYTDTLLPLPAHHHPLRSRASGPLSLSPSMAPTGPPRLSIPIPIPGGNPSRQGSGSSSLRSSSTVGTGPGALGGMLGVAGGGGGGGAERMSVSMNDLDLLLFGNPSGVSHVGAAPAAPELVMPPLGPVVSSVAGSAMTVSPLELDDGVTGGVDWGMEFEFQMGSPVSPLSPASRGKRGV
ncbi:uncharacterized protein B0H64DRAFT_466641 [Chaetomium fimeti]|uniref:Uncharacterized protein n=1 Tax=Chaetomium fimeti TaxID=1854472 RepID=A0AAE0H8V5_9PEZI|nr:hypothetical protein B0H64DRAFT_466641 [Chaetomium fimeti]